MNIKNDNVSMKKKNIFIIVSILLISVFIIGGTYAYLTFGINIVNKNIVSSTMCFDIVYDIKNDDNSTPITGTLIPSSGPGGGLSGKVSVGISSVCAGIDGYGILYLNVLNNSDKLIETVDSHCENSQTLRTLTKYTDKQSCEEDPNGIWVTSGNALKYAVYTTNDITSTTLPVKVGYLDSLGEKVIYDGFLVTNPAVSYYIYVWLDGYLIDNSYASQSFSGNISTSVSQVEDVYTVSYEGNCSTTVSNLPSFQTKMHNQDLVINSIVPVCEDYKFLGWSTSPTSGGANYQPGATYSQNEDLTLYAIWQDKSSSVFTINYDSNGGTGTMSSTTCTSDIICDLSANSFEKNDYIFNGWNTKADGSGTSYANLESVINIVTSGSTITLYAQWRRSAYQVNFDVNGGNLGTTTITTVGETTYTAPYDATYKLEVWGASGGNASNSANGYSRAGGYGGYSVGTINLNSNDILYVNVGGVGVAGSGTSIQSGGYNGGGNGMYHGGSGGGASHIATTSGILSSLISSLDKILIVAGGGGGAAVTNNENCSDGGSGGGVNGRVADINACTDTLSANGYGTGGTQISGGSSSTGSGSVGAFGLGGTYSSLNNSSYGSGGGGGGYYGGGASTIAGAGGGSGYIGNSLLTDKAMYCYNCTTSSDASTLTYTTTSVSSTPTENYAKSGNGAAIITILNPSMSVTNASTYGTLLTPTRDGYSFLGWNTKADGSGETITSSTVVNLTGDQTLYAQWVSTVPTISSVTATKGGAAVTATVSASGTVSAYYYYLTTSTTCPAFSTSTYKSSTSSSYTFTITSAGTYYVCAFAAGSNGSVQSSATRSSGVTFSTSSQTLGSGTMEMQTRQQVSSGSSSFSQYLGSAIYGNGTWNVQMGMASSKFYNLRLRLNFPSTATNVSISYCTGDSNPYWTIMRYKVRPTNDYSYWDNYSGSSYYGDYSGTFQLPYTNYQRYSFTVVMPSDITVFEANRDYYLYAWYQEGGLGTWYWTGNGGSLDTTVTYTALS